MPTEYYIFSSYLKWLSGDDNDTIQVEYLPNNPHTKQHQVKENKRSPYY